MLFCSLKTVKNASFKDFWFPNKKNQNKIWYGKFNKYTSKPYNFPHTTQNVPFFISINCIYQTKSESTIYNKYYIDDRKDRKKKVVRKPTPCSVHY